MPLNHNLSSNCRYREQFGTSHHVGPDIGMHLLMKMGWKPGQGLGKNSEGPTEPIFPSFKFDTKGLLASEEKARSLPAYLLPYGADSKHPVSMLQEYCSKKKYVAPAYELVKEDGPDHMKSFKMKVIVNGIEYQPAFSSMTKKQAKALAASVCLQACGVMSQKRNNSFNKKSHNSIRKLYSPFTAVSDRK